MHSLSSICLQYKLQQQIPAVKHQILPYLLPQKLFFQQEADSSKADDKTSCTAPAETKGRQKHTFAEACTVVALCTCRFDSRQQ